MKLRKQKISDSHVAPTTARKYSTEKELGPKARWTHLEKDIYYKNFIDIKPRTHRGT